VGTTVVGDTRIALLGESAVDRVRASFGPRIGRAGHPVPTRFFTSEAAALAWSLESLPQPQAIARCEHFRDRWRSCCAPPALSRKGPVGARRRL
jgi:hypothetical protein